MPATDKKITDLTDVGPGQRGDLFVVARAGQDYRQTLAEALAAETVYDVRAYGAVGDGVTDDATAIQAAINSCESAGGGVVFLPSATYLLGTCLTINTALVKIYGGASATLKLSASYTRGVQGQGHILISGAADVTIEDVRFDGNSAVVAADTINNFAIWATNAPRLNVRYCVATNVNSGGTGSNSAIILAGSCDYSKVHHNTIYSVSGGAIFTQGHHNEVDHNIVSGCNDVGIVFNASRCQNCTATGNVVSGIPSQAAFGVENGAFDISIGVNTISGCYGALDCNDAGYAGGALGSVIFEGNTITDLDKGASTQANTIGVLIRGAMFRNIKIVNNNFSGLVPYGTIDSFVFVQSSTEGLTIKGNTFESKAQNLPGAIILANGTHTRLDIDDNTIRSTSSTTKLTRGIWLQANGIYTTAKISRNKLENITNYGVHFDTGVSWSGELRDNWTVANVGALYQTSPWGTFAPGVVVIPHTLRNSGGRSVWWANAAPVAGTWLIGDQVWNYAPAAGGVPGWICTTGGTPGTWKAMAALAP